MRTPYAAAIAAALTVLAASAGHAQTLVSHFNFNGNATDSVSGIQATAGSGTSFVTLSNGDGAGQITGATQTSTGAQFYSFQGGNLTSFITEMQNLGSTSTFEFFLGAYTPKSNDNLFAFGSVPTPNGGTSTVGKYAIFSGDRGGGSKGLGIGTSLTGYGTESSAGTGTAAAANETIAYVFNGNGATIYVNGIAQTTTITGTSFINPNTVALGLDANGQVAGIGGGSTFPDPALNGQIDDFRIYSGALTASQVLAEYNAGPNVVAVTPEPSQTAALGLGLLGLAGLAFKARRRSSLTA